MPSAALRFYHRVDDPWSHLLLQLLPRLVATYDVTIECLTVPVAPPAYSPRPRMLARHALRDAKDLCRHYLIDFEADAELPSEADAELAARRLLAVDDATRYLALAQAIGEALFGGDHARLAILCSDDNSEDGALPTPEVARGMLACNQQRLLREGHFHGGMIGFDTNWYWGVDRLSHLEHDLLVAGHRKPGASVGVLQRRPAAAGTPAPRRDASDEPLDVDFYCTFRSPYAYLAAPRAFALEDRYPVRIRPKLMLPMKMAGFVIPDSKANYFRFDPAREALRLGMPFGNFCDPYGAGLERAMAVADLAAEGGRLAAYILSVTRGVWAEGLDLATEAGLRTCAERAGLDWQAAERRLRDEAWRTWADRHRADLALLGQYAAPTFRLGDYVTWGQDRIALLEQEIRRRLGWASREWP